MPVTSDTIFGRELCHRFNDDTVRDGKAPEFNRFKKSDGHDDFLNEC